MENPPDLSTKINGWTVATLKEYIETRLHDREHALRELANSNRTAIELVAVANQRAIDLAAEDLARRLESMNEFRDQINTERRDYLRRDFFDTIMSTFDRRFDDITTRLALIEGGSLASTRYIGWIIAGASLAISITFIVLSRIH